MDTSVSQVIAVTDRSTHAQLRLETMGVWITRYGLAVVLLLIGFLKFTAEEAAGIQPLVAHSPFMSWMYAILSVQGVSNLIGAIEILPCCWRSGHFLRKHHLQAAWGAS
ncbi:MAG: DUF417 family protein [Candidatus Acidiferrales bacterium]